MNTRTRCLLPVVGLVAGLVAGCSGGSKAAESSSTTSAMTTTTSSSAAPSTSSATSSSATSNATYAGAPGVPEAARYKTDAGAVAFAKYYLETVNKVGQAPKVGVLEALALPSCKTCVNQASTVRSLVSDRQHYNGAQFKLIGAARIADSSGVVVRVAVDQPAVSIVDENEKVVENSRAGGKAGAICHLKWTDGWRLLELQAEG